MLQAKLRNISATYSIKSRSSMYYCIASNSAGLDLIRLQVPLHMSTKILSIKYDFGIAIILRNLRIF